MSNQPLRLGTRWSWLTRGVLTIGLASLFSDLGHEITTALLPAFVVGTLGAPALALGLIEGVADGASEFCKFWGGYASDATASTVRGRRILGAGGYLVTSLGTALIGLAQTWAAVLVLRSFAWMGRGFRSPIRDALLTDQVAPSVYGRAFGFERAMDSLGAIGGPLLASGLLVALGIRPALLLAGLPGLVAGVLFFVVREERKPAAGRRPHLWTTLGMLPPRFRVFLLSVGVFGMGNFAATFLVLRATTLLVPRFGAVTGSAHSPIQTLSGGMRQRVSLATSLVHQPRVLVLDEPTVGIDPELRQAFWEFFAQLGRQGVTMIISTHHLDEAARCHRLGLMRSGQMLATGTPDAMRQESGAEDFEGAFLYFAERRTAVN